MTEEEQRIFILEHLGWTELSRSGRRGDDGPILALRGTSPNGAKNQYAPNPLKNLNTCAEMEKRISHLDEIYKLNLDLAMGYADDGFSALPIHRATAPQRCEAFLKTIKVWKP